MSARQPRFEVVRSDAGWFARFIATNGGQVWRTSEVYTRRRAAVRAIDLLTSAAVGAAANPSQIRDLDERTGATS